MATKKLPGVSRSASSELAKIKASLPSATAGGASHSRGDGTPVQVVLPTDLVRELRHQAIDGSTSVRTLILKALKRAGYKVAEEDLVDRRRRA
jgi:hypothetical protein